MAHTRADDDIVMPFIRSAKTSHNDKFYREMEQSSERRAQAAADMAGVPVSEMSDLKITNLNSTRHEGDIAAVPVVNEITRMMDATPQNTGFNNQIGLQLSQGSSVGPHASAGARMRTFLHNQHSERTSGAAVSDRPALETQQPGYRRRG